MLSLKFLELFCAFLGISYVKKYGLMNQSPCCSVRWTTPCVRAFELPLMQLPSVERDWLIADPSFSLSPVAPVDSALSLQKRK